MPQIAGTITRKSNGSLEFTPADAGTFNGLPSMGDEVTVDIAVTRTAAQVEKAVGSQKQSRAAEVPAATELVTAPVQGDRRAPKK